MGVCWQSSQKDLSKSKNKNVVYASQMNNNSHSCENIEQNRILSSENSNENENHSKNKNNNINLVNGLNSSFDESLQNFPDMEEWGNGIMKGYGIKQMPAYKCSLKIDELNQKREEFWNSKTTKQNQWRILHQACIYDHINAEEFLYKNNFKTLDSCINMCIDDEGNIYRIPNYCINDPYYELELLPKNDHNSKNIEIKLVDNLSEHKISLKVDDNITGKELVKIYTDYKKIDLNNNKIKLLFGGGIIKDNDTLYQHNVKNGYSLQVCILPN